MRTARRICHAVAWGGVAGLATLALDELMAFFTDGFGIALSLGFAAAHPLAGAVVAGLLEAVRAARRRPRWPGLRLLAVTCGVLYAASVFERVAHALGGHLPVPLTLAAAAAAVAGFAAWIFGLRLLIAREGRDATSQAIILAVLSVAAGLAVNRNLIVGALEPRALLADAGVLAGGLALALLVRGAGARRAAVAGVVATAAAAVFVAVDRPAPAAREEPGRPPHLVLIVIDTLRRDTFDAVVEQTDEGRSFSRALGPAAWFEKAISAAPWTAPSVASIMTGLFPAEHGYVADEGDGDRRPLKPLAGSVTTLAERLGRRGYATTAIVANPVLHPESGIAQGFQRYVFLRGASTKLPLLTVLGRMGLLQRDFYQDAVAVRRRLRQIVDRLPADRPHFLWLHLMDPHFPIRRHRDLSPDPQGERLGTDERLYRDETRFTLREITRMAEILEGRGLWDDALVVLLSDHGEMFESDGHRPPGYRAYGHGHTLFGELMQVPLVIRPPGGLPSERRVDVLASQTDLLDTIADLLGLDFRRGRTKGFSLAPWLAPALPAGETLQRSFTLLGATRYGPPQRGVRTERLKLIHYPDGEFPDQLYDLASDPEELEDLAPTDDERLAELRELLDLSWSRLDLAEGGARPVDYDPETRKRLEALGYL